jgi:phosphatidyl-myo-inositol dimannoside synthase
MSQTPESCLLLITGAYHTDGGIAAVNRLVIQAFAEKGYSLDILSLVEKDVNIDVRYIDPETSINYLFFSGNKYLFAISAWWTVLRHSYVYVYVDHVNLASIVAPFSWIKLCSYFVWLHGIEVFPPRPDFEGNIGLKYAWKSLSSSEHTKNVVHQNYPRLNVTACDLALDPIKYGNLPSPEKPIEKIGLKATDETEQVLGKQVILHVGRMVSGKRYKGQDSLIRAFPIIYQQNPGAQLVLAGQGDDMQRLKDLARALPTAMQARIFFPGYASDDLLEQFYKSCYVFAMPSIGEGFGLVYLEAMMRAKACLGGRVDATPCVVRDGLTGLLVDNPRSPEQVAQAINWFLSHPEETRRMGLAGYELVRSYYLFPHFQERFWKALLA